MEKEFIPYEQALALKELGFDEPCLAFYNGKFLQSTEYDFDEFTLRDIGLCYKTPLYQQAFRWFREKYQLHGKVGIYHFIENTYCYNIVSKNAPHYIHKESQFKTYEEAELECLKKLIEIVKK